MKPGDRIRWNWRKGRVPFTCVVLLVGERTLTVELATGRIVTRPRGEFQ